MLLKLQAPKAGQVELRRPELGTLQQRLSADDWLKLSDCQQRLRLALQRYMSLKHEVKINTYNLLFKTEEYLKAMNRMVEKMEKIQAEQSEILDQVREQMAAEAAIHLPSLPPPPPPPPPPLPSPPEQPQLRVVIQPLNQLKMTVKVMPEKWRDAAAGRGRPASARLRHSWQKGSWIAERRSSELDDSPAVPDPGPEPPQPDDYRLNIPREADPRTHAKNCHMAALGLVVSGFAEQLKTSVRHKPRRQAFDMSMDDFIYTAWRKRKTFAAPTVAAKRPRVDGRKRGKNRRARGGRHSRASTPVTAPTSRAQSPETEPTSRAQSPETEPTSRAQSPETEPTSRAQSPETEPTSRAQSPETEPTSRAQSPEMETTSRAQTPETAPTSRVGSPETGSVSRPGSPAPESTPGTGSPELLEMAEPSENPLSGETSSDSPPSPSSAAVVVAAVSQSASPAASGVGDLDRSPAGRPRRRSGAVSRDDRHTTDTAEDGSSSPVEHLADPTAATAPPTRLARFHGPHRRRCERCGGVGQLLVCDTCPRVFHVSCLSEPPAPDDEMWSCPHCASGADGSADDVLSEPERQDGDTKEDGTVESAGRQDMECDEDMGDEEDPENSDREEEKHDEIIDWEKIIGEVIGDADDQDWEQKESFGGQDEMEGDEDMCDVKGQEECHRQEHEDMDYAEDQGEGGTNDREDRQNEDKLNIVGLKEWKGEGVCDEETKEKAGITDDVTDEIWEGKEGENVEEDEDKSKWDKCTKATTEENIRDADDETDRIKEEEIDAMDAEDPQTWEAKTGDVKDEMNAYDDHDKLIESTVDAALDKKEEEECKENKEDQKEGKEGMEGAEDEGEEEKEIINFVKDERGAEGPAQEKDDQGGRNGEKDYGEHKEAIKSEREWEEKGACANRITVEVSEGIGVASDTRSAQATEEEVCARYRENAHSTDRP